MRLLIYAAVIVLGGLCLVTVATSNSLNCGDSPSAKIEVASGLSGKI